MIVQTGELQKQRVSPGGLLRRFTTLRHRCRNTFPCATLSTNDRQCKSLAIRLPVVVTATSQEVVTHHALGEQETQQREDHYEHKFNKSKPRRVRPFGSCVAVNGHVKSLPTGD